MHTEGAAPPAPDDDATAAAGSAGDGAGTGPRPPRRRPPDQSEIRGISTIASLPPEPRRARGARRRGGSAPGGPGAADPDGSVR